MRKQYEEQLAILHRELITMGQMCEEAITSAVRSLTHNDRELTGHVFEVDAGIDKKEREIETLCLKLLLQQQPVATDLREISSALKMISDMERIGDQASDIAELVPYMLGHTDQNEKDLQAMSKEAIKMVNDSVDSYVRRDLVLARSVIAYDDVVDEWFVRLKAELIAMIGKDHANGEYCVDLLMAAKYLERIADHATNIAEWVEYSITGKRSKNGVIPD